MSWIQENKFVAGLAGVTAVLGGVILYFGSSQGDQYNEKVTEYESLKGDYSKLQKSKPYPDKGNLQAKKTNIAKYEAVIEDVRKAFAGYKPESVDPISPEDFSNMRVKMDKQLHAAFKKAGTSLPEGTAFGFEAYTDSSAKSGATAMLSYELNAAQWLLNQLAEAKPAELNNIQRSPLSVETGQAAAQEEPPRRGKRPRRSAPVAPVKKVYTLMPMELSFTGSESSLREFLKSMVNSKQYFYSIRALRIRNEKQTPANVKDAGFPAAGGGAAGFGNPAAGSEDPFAGFELPAPGNTDAGEGKAVAPAPAVPEAPAVAPKPVAGKGERILKRVLGAENLHVFISFDILYIEGEPTSKDSDAAPKTQP